MTSSWYDLLAWTHCIYVIVLEGAGNQPVVSVAM